ncbi:MAG: adenosylcobinamide-GDP ribazoletransferase [Alphaproteobacteria bacterium]|nr:adenosylcobinamide-GDP ribazoletransferase [Alphaproteobacteria bacterium]MCW5740954.1 adenosylcobinamide-GDP ribazoletransferase [Alphaproteobacteria bacterium]
MTSENPQRPGNVEEWFAALGETATFFTRLPFNFSGAPRFRLAQRLPTLPVLGLAIGLAAGLDLAIAQWLGAGPILAAFVGLLTAIVITGALHEDGLADTADALGPAGASIERRLEILRDSRIGAFGALALIFSVGVRVAALAQLAARDTGIALLALVAAHMLSRAAIAWPMGALEPARGDGLGAGVGQPTTSDVGITLAIGGGIAFLMLMGVSPISAVLAPAVVFAVAWGMVPLARERFGGYTGDVLGATQQMAETAALVVVAMCVGWR